MNTNLSTHECLELWYAALRASIGIVVSTNDPERFRQRMYQVRREAQDESLQALSLIISPTSPESEVWVAKRIIEEPNAKG